jgi:hypothetical protein
MAGRNPEFLANDAVTAADLTGLYVIMFLKYEALHANIYED